jgi:uncharacterized protein (TIGR03437 family)
MKLDTRWMFFLIAFAAAVPVSAQGKITAVVNSATFQSDTPRGGALATVFCSGVQNYYLPGTYIAPQTKPLPTVLDGNVGIEVNGFLAPLLAVVVGTDGTAQINFQVPPGADAGISNLTGSGLTEACGDQSPYRYFNAGGLMLPGGFFSDANGYAIAQHASDYSLVTTQNPGHPGEAIIAYANDFFVVWPPPPIAFATPSQPLFLATQSPGGLYLQSYLPSGGVGAPSTLPIQVTFQGLAPGQIGVEQLNFVVPANQQPGDWPLFYSATSGVKHLSSAFVKLPVR